MGQAHHAEFGCIISTQQLKQWVYVHTGAKPKRASLPESLFRRFRLNPQGGFRAARALTGHSTARTVSLPCLIISTRQWYLVRVVRW